MTEGVGSTVSGGVLGSSRVHQDGPVLVELHVANLGVIEEMTVTPGEAMTVVTGETGAGKTLVVTAIGLLCGGRVDASLVSPGASEAVIDGRFIIDGEEVVLSRVIPAAGRSRAYVNGRPIAAAELAERAAGLVEIHGQNSHQQLLSPSAQRRALDRFAGIDTRPLEAARREVRKLLEQRDALGGDERERARNLDVLRFQLREIDDVQLVDPDEDDVLRGVEAELANAGSLRAAAEAAIIDLSAERAARDRLAAAAIGLRVGEQTGVFGGLVSRLEGLVAELDDVVVELRRVAERLVDDPGRLASVQQRRRQLTALRKKYGPSLADVMREAEALRQQVAELASADERLASVEQHLSAARGVLASEAEAVKVRRHSAAPELAAEVEKRLRHLGMGSAAFGIEVGSEAGQAGVDNGDDHASGLTPDSGDAVMFMLCANRGGSMAPLAKVASGGELSRTMLALRLVLSGGPPVAIFDEVDAGVGGDAANQVGEALAELAEGCQVLVVTHLAQIAARAGTHVVVAKDDDGDRTVTTVRTLVEASDRQVELARLLSGSPDSEAALHHAAELLDRFSGAD